MNKKIGVLGSGIVGQTLAAGFLKHGHEVMIGTSHVDKLNEWQAKNPKAKVGSFAQAAGFGEIIVLAAKGGAVLDVMKTAGIQNFSGKTVLDATNPIADIMPQKGILSFFTTFNESLMEQLQQQAPQARLVKAFNSVGSHFMVNPDFGGVKPTMFICGNSADAKKEAVQILEKFGWDTEDMGDVEAARAIEPLCILYCIPGLTRHQWMHAFKLLKK